MLAIAMRDAGSRSGSVRLIAQEGSLVQRVLTISGLPHSTDAA